MKSANLFVHCFCIVLMSAVLAKAQQRKVNYSNLHGGPIAAIEFDASNPNPDVSFRILSIPKAITKDKLSVENSLLKADVVSGNDDKSPVDTLANMYNLKFDLSSIATEMSTLGIVQRTYNIIIKGKLQGTFDIVPKNLRGKQEVQPCPGQTEFQQQAQSYVAAVVSELQLKKAGGMYVDKRGEVIHLFIDHYGKFYGKGVPTIATPDYRFKLHLITSVCDESIYSYEFTYSGTYEDDFNINNTFDSNARSGVNPKSSKIDFVMLDYAEIGPFTGTLNMKLDRKKESVVSHIMDVNVVLAKKYHVTLSAGLFSTTLKNPVDIQRVPMPHATNGDSTLVASDVGPTRGVITIMATYYLRGRSFQLPPEGPLFSGNRLGVIVGTQLSSNYKENFFGGVSFDVARGLSIAGGIHYGRQNFLPGRVAFEYGVDKYSGPLIIKQRWEMGIFAGVIIDARILAVLFPGLSSK